MRKLIAAGFTAFLLAGAGAAVANPTPGDNGHQANDHGLCTAYFAGSENGQAHKHQAGPFADLEQRASDGDDSTSPAEDVLAFCDGVTPGNK